MMKDEMKTFRFSSKKDNHAKENFVKYTSYTMPLNLLIGLEG